MGGSAPESGLGPSGTRPRGQGESGGGGLSIRISLSAASTRTALISPARYPDHTTLHPVAASAGAAGKAQPTAPASGGGAASARKTKAGGGRRLCLPAGRSPAAAADAAAGRWAPTVGLGEEGSRDGWSATARCCLRLPNIKGRSEAQSRSLP